MRYISKWTIDVPEEFDFQQNKSYLQRTSLECTYEVTEDAIQKVLLIQNQPILCEVQEKDKHKLIIHAHYEQPIPEHHIQTTVTHFIQEWFDLHTDLTPFYRMAEKDPLLKQVIPLFYGLRQIGIPHFFEAICWGIIGQQIQLSTAYTIKRNFVSAFGQDFQWNGKTYWTFPLPATIAQLTIDQLTPLKLSKNKSAYLIGIAQAIVHGELSKSQLTTLSAVDAEKKLTSYRGIGPWTAQYVMMRCLGEPTALPVTDVGLQNAIKAILNWDRKPTIEELQAYAQHWKGWESYATFYLWRFLY